MKQVSIGPNGPKAANLGIGAMSFSDFYGSTSDENSFALLDAAIAAGVMHIDTSNVYGMGRSERAIGAYIVQNGGAALRDKLHIATKAGIARDADGNRCFNNAADYLEAELDGSLARMGTDYVDLFYIHRREAERPIEEVTETLVRLIEKGKIRSFGFSEIAPSSLRRAAAVHPVAAVQSEYSLGTRAPELGLLQACAELGTAFVAFSPVMRSQLTDHPLSPDAVAQLPFLAKNPRFMAPNYAANQAQVDRLRALAADMGVSTAALAIAWVLHQGPHIMAIPGTRSTAHFAQLLEGAQLQLSAEAIAQIEAILPVGWAHGDRYDAEQWVGPERFS